MAEQSGFMAIQPPVPQAPYARRKIVRGPDGTPQVVLEDMQGNIITDPSGYGIIEAGNYYDQGSLQTATIKTDDPKPESEKSTAKSVIRDSAKGNGGRGDPSPGSGNFGRSQANNFGYINKPGFVGLAGALPGAIGMVGKAVNLGINANNTMATSTARNMLGLPSAGIGSTIKSVAKDKKGQVADVTFGNSTYATPVGLEALSPEGMTNMTPAEAAARAFAAGSINLATDDQIAARDAAFEAEFDKPGLFGRMTNVATSFLDNMFGSPAPDYAAAAAQSRAEGFSPTKSGFADMLGGISSGGGGRSSAPSYSPGVGKGATSTPGNPVSGASRSTAGKTGRGGGISPGASAAIGRGEGGLY